MPMSETLSLGDGGGDAGEDYRIMVASGDMNGRAGTASNDTIIFQPSGDYAGVFKGGEASTPWCLISKRQMTRMV